MIEKWPKNGPKNDPKNGPKNGPNCLMVVPWSKSSPMIRKWSKNVLTIFFQKRLLLFCPRFQILYYFDLLFEIDFLEGFQFRWFKIKAIFAVFPISIMLFLVFYLSENPFLMLTDALVEFNNFSYFPNLNPELCSVAPKFSVF